MCQRFAAKHPAVRVPEKNQRAAAVNIATDCISIMSEHKRDMQDTQD